MPEDLPKEEVKVEGPTPDTPKPDENITPKINSSRKFILFGILGVLVLVLIGMIVWNARPTKLSYDSSSEIAKELDGEEKDVIVSPTVNQLEQVTRPKKRANLATGFEKDGSVEITSPDGKQKAKYYDDGKEKHEFDEGGFTQNAVDVTNIVTNQKATYKLKSEEMREASLPMFWSPADNNRIYFLQSANGIGNFSLWSSEIDGSDPKFVGGTSSMTNKDVFDKADESSAIFGASSVDFSSNGKMIISARNSYKKYDEYQLWKMNLDGTNSKVIEMPEKFDFIHSVQFSADEKQIYFINNRGYKTDEDYIVNIDGTNLKRVTFVESND